MVTVLLYISTTLDVELFTVMDVLNLNSIIYIYKNISLYTKHDSEMKGSVRLCN